MAAKPSPSWTSQAHCKTLSAYCAVQCWIRRAHTAASSHTSMPNTTFSSRRLARATRRSCEYRRITFRQPQPLSLFSLSDIFSYFRAYDELDVYCISCSWYGLLRSRFGAQNQHSTRFIFFLFCRRKSMTGNWKTNQGSAMLEQMPITEKYKNWIDEVSAALSLDLIVIATTL